MIPHEINVEIASHNYKECDKLHKKRVTDSDMDRPDDLPLICKSIY